jgi:hypothetical protein
MTGPGPGYSAQLFIQGSDFSLTPLLPTSTFRPPGTGAAAIADRYWLPQTVDVIGHAPGESVTFVVRVWQTSAGSYDAAINHTESAPFTVTIGGGTLPPANLTTLQAFTLILVPEPSVIALAVIGGSILVLLRRR